VVSHAPGAPLVHVGPSAPHTLDDLVAVIDVESADPDGDAVSYTYAWKQDGTLRADLLLSTVPASETSKGQTWEVTVTPNDGALIGASASATATVLNSAPSAPIVTITPVDARGGEDLTCTVTSAASDLDDDALSYDFRWEVDGVAYEGAANAETSSVVVGAAVSEGQVWTCAVTANDGSADGAAGSASITAGAALPQCALADGAWTMDVTWTQAPCGSSATQAVEVTCGSDGEFELSLAALSSMGFGSLSCTSDGAAFDCALSDSTTGTTASITGSADAIGGTHISDGAVEMWLWYGMCSGGGTFTGSHD
jgi:hypothetical protein